MAKFSAKTVVGDNGKVFRWLAIALVVMLLLKFLGKLLRGFGAQLKSFFGIVPTDEELEQKRQEQEEILFEETKPILATANLSHPMAYYKAIANVLESAMNSYGTSFSLMMKKLQPLTGYELIAVADQFGSRRYEMGSNDQGVLFQWFEWELTDSVLIEYATSFFGLWNVIGAGGKTELQQMRALWKKAEDCGMSISF